MWYRRNLRKRPAQDQLDSEPDNNCSTVGVVGRLLSVPLLRLGCYMDHIQDL